MFYIMFCRIETPLCHQITNPTMRWIGLSPTYSGHPLKILIQNLVLTGLDFQIWSQWQALLPCKLDHNDSCLTTMRNNFGEYFIWLPNVQLVFPFPNPIYGIGKGSNDIVDYIICV